MPSSDLLARPPAAARAGSRVCGHRDPVQLLTRRELDVLQLVAQGRSNAAIAQQLQMSPKTVESHIGKIFTRFDLAAEPQQHRRVLAVLVYLDHRFDRGPAPVPAH